MKKRRQVRDLSPRINYEISLSPPQFSPGRADAAGLWQVLGNEVNLVQSRRRSDIGLKTEPHEIPSATSRFHRLKQTVWRSRHGFPVRKHQPSGVANIECLIT